MTKQSQSYPREEVVDLLRDIYNNQPNMTLEKLSSMSGYSVKVLLKCLEGAT
tara:strand:- start:1798 stop:1953 length:156 start_codon:yes stop_codon:yes gene_type:complete